jgi:hypothetical protein
MIPSDHFVKFYSEIFKYLEKQGRKAVDEYYLTISRHQENHCLELFQKKGIVGMNEYWELRSTCSTSWKITTSSV